MAAAKREVLRMVAWIRVIPVGQGSHTPLPDRVHFAGLIAGDPVAEEPQPQPMPLTGTE